MLSGLFIIVATRGDRCTKQAQARVDELYANTSSICASRTMQLTCGHLLVRTALPRLWAAADADSRSGCDAGCTMHTLIDGDFLKLKRHAALMVKSFIVTQPSSMTLSVWTSQPHMLEVLLGNAVWSARQKWDEGVLGRVAIKDIALIPGRHPTAAESAAAAAAHAVPSQGSFRADALRILVLKAFGGIWIDSDTLLLADLSPLCGATFAGRWSYLKKFNNAFLGCQQECSFATAIVAEASRANGPGPMVYHAHRWSHGTPFGDMLKSQGTTLPTMLPARICDPVWLMHDGKAGDKDEVMIHKFKDFEGKPLPPLQLFNTSTGLVSFESLFPGGLVYHWHGSRYVADSKGLFRPVGPKEMLPIHPEAAASQIMDALDLALRRL